MSMDIVTAMDSEQLFAPWFRGASWDTWRAVLRAAYALPMNADEREAFRAVAGDREPPAQRVREMWASAGRRAGKDSVASLIVAYSAALFDQCDKLRPGERALCVCIACDRDQARIALSYVKGYFAEIPELAAMVTRETVNGLELTNSVEVQVVTNDFRAVRGKAILCAVLDECAFFRDEDSATPDLELYRAILPGMVTLPGSILIGISSPYRRAGLLYTKVKNNFGHDGDILVIQGASRQFNPTIAQAEIDRAVEDDPQSAKSEWLGEFRDDISSFISLELIEGAVDSRVTVRPPAPGFTYVAGVDASSGTGRDSFGVAVAHRESGGLVVDLAHEIKPPFSALTAIAEAAAVVREYGIREVCGDRYAPGFVAESFAKHGIAYRYSERDRSSIYLETLPLFTSGKVRLVDSKRLVAQFVGLERKTSSSGKDRVDHPDRGHDDLSNAVALAIIESHTNVGLLARLEDCLVDGGPAPEPQFPRRIVASIVRGERGEHLGRAGAAIFASRPTSPGVKLVLIDVVSGDFGVQFLAEVYRRLQAWAARLQPRRDFGAIADAETAQAYDNVFVEIAQRQFAEGLFDHRASGCQKFPPQMLARQDLAAAAAGIIQSGYIKLGADLLEKSARHPIASLLDFRAGDVEEPLRRALVLGIVAS